MSEIANIGSVYPSYPPAFSRLSFDPPQIRTSHPADIDRAELSALGSVLARSVEPSSLTLARAGAIRAEIAAGTYETVERIEGTVARLIDVLA